MLKQNSSRNLKKKKKKRLWWTHEWPRSDYVEVEKQFIFYGPINLLGSDPFQVTKEKKQSL